MENKSHKLAIEFLDWCNTPMYQPVGHLAYLTRVIAQFPDYKLYVIINEKGQSVLDEHQYFTAEEVFNYFIENHKNDN